MPSQNPVIAAAQRAASAAVTKTAASPSNDMSGAAVAAAKPEMDANITAAIAADPVVKNATNTEDHWYQKRSMWSTLASTVTVAGTIGYAIFQYMSNQNLDEGLTIGVVIGAVWAGYSAYRAGTALMPLGTDKSQLPYPMNK